MQGQTLAGDWHGTLDFSGMKLRLVFHIEEADGNYTATMDSPDQGASGIPVEKVSLTDQEVEINLPKLGISYKGELDAAGSRITGNFQQGGAVIPLELGREAQEKPVIKRPQEPEGPLPYREEEVTYDNAEAEGVTLAGTLSLPVGDGPFPAVILISGSGPQDRNEELLGHKPFLVIADHFTRTGIAVLRFDDRGVAGSTGDFKAATSQDFASDVRAGISFLQKRTEIDRQHIGLVGHSEGGLIAPIVAADNPDVDFIVMMAGPGVNGTEILLLQQQLIARAEGASEEEIERTRKASMKMYEDIRKTKDLERTKKELVEYVKKELDRLSEQEKSGLGDLDKLAKQQVETLSGPWFRYFLSYDPQPTLKKVSCPVLAINGSKDLQVDAEQNIPMIEKALKAGGNKQFTTRVLPGLNHLFQHSETGRSSEYGQLEETFAPEALDLMTDWIREQVE
ncbi:alpha/beta hydrolase family protein [Flavilitoribacter nigricans]|uniref:Alpha/beta hydrolase n=1 Tax=Flavilitoribacter nigricans (strain ATCC 23147 / DSM 23189 / NBRC 102662 / NCIMB 1420 / SS-2) TaxID=1122177 RepID=A0A2D0NAK1_FLAN2|nr:alpha/beta fold hydrolase [Flavilitoribacter nigricans]PHN05534.1 alpha/beta hydrolase [Flavilitoribacter nigricans DSM 23189 = NBRC 102662]